MSTGLNITDHRQHGRGCLYMGMRTLDGLNGRVVDILNEAQIQQLDGDNDYSLYIRDEATTTYIGTRPLIQGYCNRSVSAPTPVVGQARYERLSHGFLVSC
jgi:hypothetical protein